MRHRSTSLALFALAAVVCPASAEPSQDKAAGLALEAVEVRRVAAPEAHQGVAAGLGVVYAIGDHEIAAYDPDNGRPLRRWQGDPQRYPHINSCELVDEALVCAASNYPAIPMRSEILWFDTATLTPLRGHDLGHGHGSLTWVARHDGAWWACYANYDAKGGEPGRDHKDTTLVRLDDAFRETGVWTFPITVLERIAPRSISGGSWSDDGLLYVTGHDRPEVYVLEVPADGGVLRHVGTITTPTGGQAISWARQGERVLWSIDRARSELVASRVPPIEPGPSVP